MARELVCWNCGKSIADIPLPISRHANCAHCYEVLRCCRQCRHFNAAVQGQCEHERADPPVVKESANFCDYFKPSPNRFSRDSSRKHDGAKSEFAALFGGEVDEGNGDGSDEAKVSSDLKSKLDDLFDN